MICKGASGMLLLGRFRGWERAFCWDLGREIRTRKLANRENKFSFGLRGRRAGGGLVAAQPVEPRVGRLACLVPTQMHIL